MVWVGHQVDIHQQLGYDAAHGVAVIAVRMEIAHHGKAYIAKEHKAQQLSIMEADEGQRPYSRRRAALILVDEAEAADKQKHGHSVVSEKRHNVYKQVVVERQHALKQLSRLRCREGVFVLLYGKAQKVAVVVKNYSQYGYAPEGLRLSHAQQFFFHCLKLFLSRRHCRAARTSPVAAACASVFNAEFVIVGSVL